MRYDASNGYVGWRVIDRVAGILYEWVLLVDPDAKEFRTIDQPVRLVGDDLAGTTHRAEEITLDFSSQTFWIKKATVLVAPLSLGRQHTPEHSDKPCSDCRQEGTCRRIDYCAAHRGPFGERAP